MEATEIVISPGPKISKVAEYMSWEYTWTMSKKDFCKWLEKCRLDYEKKRK